MTRTKSNRNRRTAALLTLAAAVALSLSAATSAKAEEEGELAPPVALVELFTSQGCYSCPPADKVLAEEFAVRDDVAALELHVDYWDDLVYGGSVWADPYSDRDYTRRQTDYNIKIRDTRTVYTPQAVIHGHKQAAGTQSSRIAAAVEESLQTAPATRFRFLSAKSESDSESERRVRLEGPIQPGRSCFTRNLARAQHRSHRRRKQGQADGEHQCGHQVGASPLQPPRHSPPADRFGGSGMRPVAAARPSRPRPKRRPLSLIFLPLPPIPAPLSIPAKAGISLFPRHRRKLQSDAARALPAPPQTQGDSRFRGNGNSEGNEARKKNQFFSYFLKLYL